MSGEGNEVPKNKKLLKKVKKTLDNFPEI